MKSVRVFPSPLRGGAGGGGGAAGLALYFESASSTTTTPAGFAVRLAGASHGSRPSFGPPQGGGWAP
jgi:hypothetical protein